MSRRAGTPTAKKVTQLVNVEEHVEGFRQVREAHRRELIDDYVELISDLIREVGEARQVDMAARLGVSQPTVAKMLKRLATITLHAGDFAVFMPEEPHQALCAIGTATSIRKAVFKVPRDMLEA